jgi:DNA-binding MarR family transcriptional regulator
MMSAKKNERQHLVDRILNLQARIWEKARSHPPTEWLDVDLTMQQLKTLFVLYGSKATMTQLVEPLGVTHATVTGIVDRLVEHGLVKREEDPNDRRTVVGCITEKGRQLMKRLITAVQLHLTEILERLNLEELRKVAKALDILKSAQLEENPK